MKLKKHTKSNISIKIKTNICIFKNKIKYNSFNKPNKIKSKSKENQVHVPK